MCIGGVREYVHMITGACRVQKRESDPLKLELEVVVSLPMWVPEHKHGISAKAKRTVHHWACSPILWMSTPFDLWILLSRPDSWKAVNNECECVAVSAVWDNLKTERNLNIHKIWLPAKYGMPIHWTKSDIEAKQAKLIGLATQKSAWQKVIRFTTSKDKWVYSGNKCDNWANLFDAKRLFKSARQEVSNKTQPNDHEERPLTHKEV